MRLAPHSLTTIFLEKPLLSLELLDKNIAECKEYVDDGKEEQSTLDFLLKLREDLANSNEADWEAYNELTNHLPNEDADPVLIILKGQLLLERLVRIFIASRLPNPEALDKQQFSAAHCIAIAESMCLDNDEPRWLWAQIKELNTIRNKLAHSLENEKVEVRINNFVTTVSNAQNLQSKTLTSVISRLYGMLKGICDLSESNEFKLHK